MAPIVAAASGDNRRGPDPPPAAVAATGGAGASGGLGPDTVVGHRLEDRELHLVGADRPHCPAVKLLQQSDRALGIGLGTLDPERLVAALDLHVERRGQRAQVFVEAARQVGQARVVGRDESVTEDQAGIVANRLVRVTCVDFVRVSGGKVGSATSPKPPR